MFEGLTIIDCSTVLAGPSVATFFAELGARVIKFENPTNPDVTRSWKLASEDPQTPISAYFSSVNYRKSYAAADFKDPINKENVLHALKDADVFISNFKKGDAEKFGLEDEHLLKLNPRLIIGKISGYGTESDRVAYDLILQAESGFMSMNGTPDSGPVKMPVALIDVLAAHQLKEGILCALYKRTSTNKGSVVSVSLYDAAICSLANQASNYLMAQHVPQRIGSLHPNIAPYGEIFQTSDNKLITFAIGNDRHFKGLCDFLNLSELSQDPRFYTNVARVTNRVALYEMLSNSILNLQSERIQEAMNAQFIPMGIIKSLDEVFMDETAQRLIRTEQIGGIETKRVSQVAFQLS
jgi:crotonobetainyl-CoA:carnitine CoA-transferase CaiB-like acyl-CoA transferase